LKIPVALLGTFWVKQKGAQMNKTKYFNFEEYKNRSGQNLTLATFF